MVVGQARQTRNDLLYYLFGVWSGGGASNTVQGKHTIFKQLFIWCGSGGQTHKATQTHNN